MTIEITGVNRWNKGAELMLVAVHEHFAHHHPDVLLAVDSRFGSYHDRARYGLLYKAAIQRFGRSKLALALMPPAFRKASGLVTDDDIDAVLDASGFAFGDQHPPERTLRFAQRVQEWRSKGKAVVLLPQALGPFEDARIRSAFGSVIEAANHVFARDDISLDHAKKTTVKPEHISLAPDFTNLVKPVLGAVDADRVCIVPNQRMIEKATSTEAASSYVPLLCACIEAVTDAGLSPVLLIHGSHDAGLVKDVHGQLGRELPVYNESDPIEIKRILGRSRLVIGSRFHALVSALSQGVPAIATSWSHKYEMLFRDYGCQELILPVPAAEDQVRQAVGAATGTARPELVERIEKAGERLVRQSKDMWAQVDRILGLPAA